MHKTLIVGTLNPVKINAVKSAFETVWPDCLWQVQGVAVPSGVSNQPISPAEGLQGARNRAHRALESSSSADYGIGLEGGLEETDGLWFDCGWCVIVDREGKEGISTSARIPTPESMMKYIREGKELGEALDLMHNRTNIKQQEGHVGILTNTIVTRTDIYKDAAIIALGRFLHPELFE